MAQYEQKRADGLTEAEWTAKVRAANNALPHLPLPSVFDPSGLVPYPCNHGIAAKPARYPRTRRIDPWLDKEGNERPPYGGRTWGRGRYLRVTSFGKRSDVPYADVKVHRLRGSSGARGFLHCGGRE